MFATLALLTSRRFGRAGVIVLALVWAAVSSVLILASVPGPEVPLHDFERSPVPDLLGMLAGTAAATAFAMRPRQPPSVPLRILAVTAVYLAVAVLVGVTAALWVMS